LKKQCNMKKPLEELTKAKLIYSGEILLFSIAFIVLGTLELTGILHISDILLNIFKYITTVGGCLVIGEFIWTLVSKKKKEKSCLLDKFLVIPVPLYLLTIDILIFANNVTVIDNREYFIAPVLLYLGLVYAFQAIYHYYFPTKEVYAIAEESIKEKQEKNEGNNKSI